jgi:acetylornithine/succinyldiaminopimelate/putrescine aminotransferase
MEAFKVLLENDFNVPEKENRFQSLLQHSKIKSVRSFGLWMAIEFDSFETCKKIIDKCIEKGVLTDWFLFASNYLRISPPLSITKQQIERAATVIINALNESN